MKDLTSRGLVGITPRVLAANHKHGFTSVAHLMRKLKPQRGKFTFMSAGIGSEPHLGGEGFKAQAGINMLHIPFKGTGLVLPRVKSGKLKVLAVRAPKRLARQPDVVTISEPLPRL